MRVRQTQKSRIRLISLSHGLFMCLMLFYVNCYMIGDPDTFRDGIELVQDRKNVEDDLDERINQPKAGGFHRRRLTGEADSAKTAMEGYDCSNAYPWILHPFKKDQTGQWLKNPHHLFFEQNTNDGVSGTTFYNILGPVRIEDPTHQTAASRCAHQCTPYIQTSANLDGENIPDNPMICGSDQGFELLSSSTHAYADLFSVLSDGQIIFSTTTVIKQMFLCYVCTATPTDGSGTADPTKIGTLKTWPFDIGVGSCSNELTTRVDSQEQVFIQDADDTNIHYFSIAPWTFIGHHTNNNRYGCIKEYVITGDASLTHAQNPFTGTTVTQSASADCPDLAIGMACLIFRFVATSAFDREIGRYCTGANLYDGTSMTQFSSGDGNRISVIAKADSCSTQTMACKYYCSKTSPLTSFSFAEPSTGTNSERLTQFETAHDSDCTNNGYGNGKGNWFFQTSDNTNCPLKMVKLFADQNGAMQVQNNDFSQHSMLMKVDMQTYTDDVSSETYYTHFANGRVNLNATTTWERNYYLRGYNAYGTYAQCSLTFAVCGAETFTKRTDTGTSVSPYVVNIVLSTTPSTTHTMTTADIFSPNLWVMSGPTACYQQFPTNTNFQVVNSETDSGEPTGVTVVFDGLSSQVHMTIDDTTATTINTFFRVTTQGAKSASAYVNFVIAAAQTATVSSVSAANSPIAVANTIADLTLTNTFAKATYIEKFSSSLNSDAIDSLVLGETDANGNMVASTIAADSVEASVIQIASNGDFVVDLSQLTALTIAKFYSLTAQTVSGKNGISNPGASAAGSSLMVCIPPYMQTPPYQTRLTVTYDAEDTAITWLHEQSSPTGFTTITSEMTNTKTKTMLDNMSFAYTYGAILFNAMPSGDISANVDVVIAQADNSDVQAKLSSTFTAITLTSVGTLIDTLTSSGRSQDVTYKIYLQTKPKSTVTDYNGNDFSLIKWQACHFYQLWQLRIKAVQNDIFWLASATNDVKGVLAAFNTDHSQTGILKLKKSDMLAKFTGSCAPSCGLDTLIIAEISNGAIIDISGVDNTVGTGNLLYISAAGDLEVNFANLPTKQITKRYALYAQIGTGIGARNSKTNAKLTAQDGYILEICIPPYIKSSLDAITITVVKNADSTFDYTYNKGSTTLVTQTSQQQTAFEAADLVYTLPAALFGDKDSAWVATNVQHAITADSTSNTAVQTRAAFATDLSTLTISSMHTVVSTLTGATFVQASTAFALTIKTSLKAQTVGAEDYSLTKWSTCVHYTTLSITFDVSSLAPLALVYLTSSSNNLYSSTNGPTGFTGSDTVPASTGLAYFTSSQAATDDKSVLILGQIDQHGALVASGISAGSTEASFIKIDGSGNLVIDYSVIHSFTISKTYALSAQLASGRNGIVNPDTSNQNGYIFQICIPPYFSTAFDDLTLSLAYSTSQVNYTFSQGSISESNKTTTELNAVSFSYTLPSILFGAKNSAWVASNVEATISSANTTISSYLSISNFILKIDDVDLLIGALTSEKDVLASTDFTITIKSSLKSQTVDNVDYSTWQACEFYQDLKLTLVSTMTADVVDTVVNNTTTTDTTPTTTTTQTNSTFNAQTVIESKTKEVNCTETPTDESCAVEETSSGITVVSNSTEETVEEEVVEETEEEVEDDGASVIVNGKVEPVINLSTYNPFEEQSNFAGVVMKKPVEESKAVSFKCDVNTTGSVGIKFNQELIPSGIFAEYEKYKKELEKTGNETKEGNRRRLSAQDEINKLVDIKLIKDPTAPEKSDEDDEKQEYTVIFNEVSKDGKSVTFDLGFDKPEEISSQGSFRDSLSIVLNQNYFKKLFVTSSGEFLKFEKQTAQQIKYEISLPLQAPPPSSAQFKVFLQQKSVADGQVALTIITITINYLIQAAFSQIWSAAYALQLITYLTLINIIYPQCTIDLFEILINLASFDLIPEDQYQPYQEWLLPLPSDQGLSYSFIELGYETGYIMVTMFFVLFLLSLQTLYYAVFFLVYKITKRRSCKSKKVNNYAKGCLVNRYSFYLRSLLSCCLEIFVSAFIEIIMHQTITPYEKASYFLSVILLVALFFFGRQCIFIFNEQYFKMKDTDDYPVFNNKWSTMWEGMRGESEQIQPYLLFFIGRRFLYAAIIVFIPVYTNINSYTQYFMVVQLNLYSCCYIIGKWPFESRSRNLTEFFNEWVNLNVSTWFLIAMISIEGDETGRLYNIGLMCNYLVLGMISVNFFFVIGTMIVDIKNQCLRKNSLRNEKAMYLKLWNESKQKIQQTKDQGKRDFKKERIASKNVTDLEKKIELIEKIQSGRDAKSVIKDCLIEESVDEADKHFQNPLQQSKLKHFRVNSAKKQISKDNKKLHVIVEDSQEDENEGSGSSSSSSDEIIVPEQKVHIIDLTGKPPALPMGDTQNLGETSSKIPAPSTPKTSQKPSVEAAAIKERQTQRKDAKKFVSKWQKYRKSLQ